MNTSSDNTQQIAALPQEHLERIRNVARNSLYFFAKWVLGYDKLDVGIHKPICDLLQNHNNLRVKITLPRGWYKSTLINAFMIWCAVRDPNIRILLVMNTHDNAVLKLGSIDAHFRQNEIFRVLFPEIMPDDSCTWTTESMCVKRTSSWPESTFEAAGTRTKVVSRHYDIIIEDDTVSPNLDEITEDNMLPTKEDIGQAIGWHKLANPLLNDLKTSRMIVVGTRWFEKDLLSYIDENEPSYVSYSRAAVERNGVPDESGLPTFPAQFPADVLATLRQAMGPYMFSCLYQNKPIRSGDMLFQAEWFGYYDKLPPTQRLQFYTTVDPGGDPEETMGEPDWNVVLSCAKDMETGIVYVVKVDRGKWHPGQLIDMIFNHIEWFAPRKVGIEAVQYQKSLMYFVRERMKQEKIRGVTIEPIVHKGRSKNIRIMGLQPLFSAGRLLIRTSHEPLRNELLTFPYGKHDDMADALSMQLVVLPRTTGKAEVVHTAKPEDNLGVTFDWALESLRSRGGQQDAVYGPVSDLLRVQNPETMHVDAATRFFNKRRAA